MAPQSLFLMNDKLVVDAAAKFATRLEDESKGDLSKAIDLVYRMALQNRRRRKRKMPR
jgi:Cdc6-like AAA superfamily ATPase